MFMPTPDAPAAKVRHRCHSLSSCLPLTHVQKADIFGLDRSRKMDVPLPVPYKSFVDVEEY